MHGNVSKLYGLWLGVLLVSLTACTPELRDASAQTPIDLTRYWPTVAGTTWTMHTVNVLTAGSGDVTITIEPQTTWQGIAVTPWLFRKTTSDSYWAPGFDQDLRWYVVAASVFLDAPDRTFNSFFWVLGHHALTRATNTIVYEVVYRAGLPSPYPPYPLAPKRCTLPCDLFNDQGQNLWVRSPGTVGYSPILLAGDMQGQWSSWWSRSAFVPSIPGWGDNGGDTEKLLRTDFYEGSVAPFDQRIGSIVSATYLLRESWYFQRDVGMVVIRTKNHSVDDGSHPYTDDPDFTTLHDPERVRTPDAVLLRAIGRAAQWVALRHRLVLQTYPLTLLADVPWYHLPTVLPQLVLMTDVATATGVPLHPVPMSRLRYVDRSWLRTTGPLARYYRVGWTYVGFAPVPAVAATVAVTGLVVPAPAGQSTDSLEGVSGYDDSVIQVATGLLLCGRERTYKEGIARVRAGLGLKVSQELDLFREGLGIPPPQQG
jgi:hypothetical protein